MNFFSNIKKNRAIKSYIRKLPRLLNNDYGREKQYTPKQIRSTAERHGLNLFYISFGIAMFSDKSQFDKYHKEIEGNCCYEDMRSEVGNKYFGGDSSFEVSSFVGVPHNSSVSFYDGNDFSDY